MYTVDLRRVLGSSLILGDYSMGGSFLLTHNSNNCTYSFSAEIYTYDEFNADLHTVNDGKQIFRNSYAILLQAVRIAAVLLLDWKELYKIISSGSAGRFVTRTKKKVSMDNIKEDESVNFSVIL